MLTYVGAAWCCGKMLRNIASESQDELQPLVPVLHLLAEHEETYSQFWSRPGVGSMQVLIVLS